MRGVPGAGPGEGGVLHQEVLAHYDPSQKGTQPCKLYFKKVFVRANTNLHLPLVLFKEVKPAFTQDLKSLIFSLGLSETFRFILRDPLGFSTTEQFGD